MTFAYSMMASRNCALAKYWSPRSRCWAFLASGDLEHPVMTTNTDRRRAIHTCTALDILVSSVIPIRGVRQNRVHERRLRLRAPLEGSRGARDLPSKPPAPTPH